MSAQVRVCVVLTLMLSHAASESLAVTRTWTGLGAGPLWGDPDNWSPNDKAPDTGDDAVIGGGSVDFNGVRTLGRLEMGGGAEVTIGQGETLNLTSNSENHGAIRLADVSTTSDAARLGISGSLTLEGAGEVVFVTNENNRVGGPGTLTLKQAIRALAGSRGVLEAKTVNASQVIADAGGELTIDADINNGGVLRSHGVMNLFAPITNLGGSIVAEQGGLVTFNDEIRGGALVGDGVAHSLNGVLDGGPGMLLAVDRLVAPIARDLTLRGQITNNSRITFEGAALSTSDLRVDGVVTLDGAGVIELDGTGNRIRNHNTNGDHLVLGAGQVVRTTNAASRGDVSVDELTLDGLFQLANDSRVDIDGTAFTNRGAVSVGAGAQLDLVDTNVTNSGGQITIGVGARVNQNNTTITNGLVQGAGVLRVGGVNSVLGGGNVEVDGAIVEVFNARVLTLNGRVENNGTFRLQDVGSGNATLATNGPVDFDGDGQLLFTTSGTNEIDATAGRFTIGADQTVRTESAGDRGRLEGDFHNDGLVDTADGVIDLRGVGLVNRGTVRVRQGGRFDIQSGSSLHNDGGLVTGVGEILVRAAGGFTNEGVVAPGLGLGEIEVLGDFEQQAGGELAIELGGTQAGVDFDVLSVTGDAALDGLLSVTLDGGFAPSLGQAFTVLPIAGARTGTFDGLSEGDTVGDYGGVRLRLTYSGGDGDDVSLFTAPLVEGDYNNDGVVDAADYTVWRDSLWQTGFGLAADGDGDGLITTADRDVWAVAYGVAAANAVAVPEPATATLLALLAAAALGRRSRA